MKDAKDKLKVEYDGAGAAPQGRHCRADCGGRPNISMVQKGLTAADAPVTVLKSKALARSRILAYRNSRHEVCQSRLAAAACRAQGVASPNGSRSPACSPRCGPAPRRFRKLNNYS